MNCNRKEKEMPQEVLPKPLDIGGNAREAIYPVHNAISLDECRAALKNLGDWREIGKTPVRLGGLLGDKVTRK